MDICGFADFQVKMSSKYQVNSDLLVEEYFQRLEGGNFLYQSQWSGSRGGRVECILNTEYNPKTNQWRFWDPQNPQFDTGWKDSFSLAQDAYMEIDID
jgi:hypothetical protein